MVKCNISVKLQNHSFLDICLYELFPLLSCEDLTLEFCPSILDTLHISKINLSAHATPQLCWINKPLTASSQVHPKICALKLFFTENNLEIILYKVCG
jgi:hypothetical protein